MPVVTGILSETDKDSLKVTSLLDLDRLPTWTGGRLAFIGDAAHSFLSHQGQGGGVAIEGTASLAVFLPEGTTSEEVPERLKLYEKCRMERAHKVQEDTRMAG